MLRRRLLATTIPAALMALASRGARADSAQEVRFARQFSMGYLQFNVMEDRGLVEKHAAALGMPGVKVSWLTFNGPDAMNTALISGSVDVVAGGVPGLLTLWSKTKGTAQEVLGISALSSQPCLLNTRNEAARTIADLTAQDKIAVPTVKVSIQAVILEMAAAKLFGAEQFAKLDPLTVSMSPPDATVALLGGGAGITCAFSVPPFQTQQLEKPGIRTLLNSFDVAGPHSFTLAWAPQKFRASSPTLYNAVVAALREATDIVNADKQAAGALWVKASHSTLSPEKVGAIVAGPQVTWTMAPENTMRFATFMQQAGVLKAVPAKWQDLFFADVHDLKGS